MRGSNQKSGDGWGARPQRARRRVARWILALHQEGDVMSRRRLGFDAESGGNKGPGQKDARRRRSQPKRMIRREMRRMVGVGIGSVRQEVNVRRRFPGARGGKIAEMGFEREMNAPVVDPANEQQQCKNTQPPTPGERAARRILAADLSCHRCRPRRRAGNFLGQDGSEVKL